MSQIDNHLKWCLKEEKRLKKVPPDEELADKHLKKSEHNVEVMNLLEESGHYDWALNVGFYVIYHCFLALLAKYGYESRNQSCSITALLKLIEDKKLEFDKDLVMQFDTLDVEKNAENPTVRENRESSTYGVETNVDHSKLKEIKELIKKIQKGTIKIMES